MYLSSELPSGADSVSVWPWIREPEASIGGPEACDAIGCDEYTDCSCAYGLNRSA